MSRIIPFWRNRALLGMCDDRPIEIGSQEAAEMLAMADQQVLLGLEGPGGIFAADLSSLDYDDALQLTGASDLLDIRKAFPLLAAATSSRLAYARGLLHWHSYDRFCGTCGEQTVSSECGSFRSCPECGSIRYPRIEPAVIALIEDSSGERCLFLTKSNKSKTSLSLVAGFVEIGEQIEQAVQREAHEEAGISLASISYRLSQPWPFPSALMLGFRAKALDDSVRPDLGEIQEAGWFTRDEAVRLYFGGRKDDFRRLHDSIEASLVGEWINEGRS